MLAVGGAQVPAVLVVVVVVLAGAAQVPVALVEAAGAPAPLQVERVLLRGEFPRIQMVQIQLDGGHLLPRDGKVQLRKLIVAGMFSYFTVHMNKQKNYIIYNT